MIEKRLVNVCTYYERHYYNAPKCPDYYPYNYRFAEEVKLPVERVGDIYNNLKNLLAIRERGLDVRTYGYYGKLALFSPEDHHWHEVRWMPKLKEGWHRLTFPQFLELYRITPF